MNDGILHRRSISAQRSDAQAKRYSRYDANDRPRLNRRTHGREGRLGGGCGSTLR